MNKYIDLENKTKMRKMKNKKIKNKQKIKFSIKFLNMLQLI